MNKAKIKAVEIIAALAFVIVVGYLIWKNHHGC